MAYRPLVKPDNRLSRHPSPQAVRLNEGKLYIALSLLIKARTKERQYSPVVGDLSIIGGQFILGSNKGGRISRNTPKQSVIILNLSRIYKF